MKIIAAINAPLDTIPAGAVPAVCDAGAGGVNGKWVAEIFKGGWNGTRNEIDPAAARVFFAAVPKGEMYISNLFEGRWDTPAMKQLNVALATARARELPVAHYNFPTSDPVVNDRVHRLIGKNLTHFAPAWNFDEPGDVMTDDELQPIVARLAESLRMSVRFNKPLCFQTGATTSDGRDPGAKLDQLARIVRSFGADPIIWAANSNDFVLSQVRRLTST